MLVYNSWSINTFLSTSLQTTHILQSRIMYRSHAITFGYLSIAILHNQSSSYASVLLGKCTYQNTYVKWMQEYSNKLFIKYSSKAYILTNSLEKTLHHFLFRFNIFFLHILHTINKTDRGTIKTQEYITQEIVQRSSYIEWKNLYMHTVTLNERRKTPPMSFNKGT